MKPLIAFRLVFEQVKNTENGVMKQKKRFISIYIYYTSDLYLFL